MGAPGPTVHFALRQLDGLLLLAPAALAPWRSSSLWLVPCAYALFVLLGRRNADFAFRCPDGDGVLFAVCVGPVLVGAYDGQETLWSGTIVSADLLTLGSLQALLDFTLAMGPAMHAAQLLAFAVAGLVLAEFPLPPLVIFLVVQKLTACWCFGRRRWGRCFSPAEGLFWAQAAAAVCACFYAGCATGFAGWSCMGAFSGFLLFFGAAFLALTAAAHAAGARGWAPLGAAAACLALGLAWGATGLGLWPPRCPEPPLAWLAGLLAEHAQLLLLQWPAVLCGGVAAIDLAARRLLGADPAARGATGGASPRLRQLLLRKAFHALALALFAPPLVGGRAAFLGFALLLAALLFVALEACRACHAPGLGRRLDAFVGRYLDAREDARRGDLVLTHLYLLLGCALPVWLEAGGRAAQPALLRGAGLVLVGVGDACAAAVGAAVGRRRWPASHRTLEGSTAYAAGALLAAAGLMGWERAAGAGGPAAAPAELAAFVGATLLSALVEVYTRSIDNLVLPLFFLPSCRALAGALR